LKVWPARTRKRARCRSSRQWIGFVAKSVAPDWNAASTASRSSEGRDHQDGDVLAIGQRPDRATGLESVEARQLDVEDDQIRSLRPDLSKSVLSVFRLDDAQSRRRELESSARPEARIVVDHEHERGIVSRGGHDFSSSASPRASSASTWAARQSSTRATRDSACPARAAASTRRARSLTARAPICALPPLQRVGRARERLERAAGGRLGHLAEELRRELSIGGDDLAEHVLLELAPERAQLVHHGGIQDRGRTAHVDSLPRFVVVKACGSQRSSRAIS
jgi:hypothetical protein